MPASERKSFIDGNAATATAADEEGVGLLVEETTGMMKTFGWRSSCARMLLILGSSGVWRPLYVASESAKRILGVTCRSLETQP